MVEDNKPDQDVRPPLFSAGKSSAPLTLGVWILMLVFGFLSFFYLEPLFWTHTNFPDWYLIVPFLFFLPALILFLRIIRLIELNKKALSIVILGPVLIVLPLLPHAVDQGRWGSYDSDSKSNLHNLFLGCKAYWADNGPDVECNVPVVANDKYGFVQSERVNIEVNGTESTFTATAQHLDSPGVYHMDAKGNIVVEK